MAVQKLWSPQINDIMVAAAEWAGIPNVNLVPEPEAAASRFLHGELKRDYLGVS